MARGTTIVEWEAVNRALRRVHLGEAALVERRQDLERLLLRLRSEGVGVTELARLTGLSREGVYEACRRGERPLSPKRLRQFVRGRGLA